MTEAQFQSAVIDLAKWMGWQVFHPRTVHTATGHHLTPYIGDQGFPDLVLAHPQRGVMFVELKTDKGRITSPQARWREYLELGGAEYHLWRPKDWNAIKNRLKGKPRP